MSNKNYIFYNKLLHNLKHNFSSYKVIILILLLISLIIIFLINYSSVFKIIEGNYSCKFTNKEKMKQDVEKKANKYKNDKSQNRSDEVNKSKSVLSRVEGVEVDIPEK